MLVAVIIFNFHSPTNAYFTRIHYISIASLSHCSRARAAVQNERQPRTSAQVREEEVEELELEWAARARHAAAGATAVSATHPRFLPGSEPGTGTGGGSSGGTEPGNGNCTSGAIGSVCTDSGAAGAICTGTGAGASADCVTSRASVRHSATEGDTGRSGRPSKRAQLHTDENGHLLEPKHEQSALELNAGGTSGGRRSDHTSDSNSQLSLKRGTVTAHVIRSSRVNTRTRTIRKNSIRVALPILVHRKLKQKIRYCNLPD